MELLEASPDSYQVIKEIMKVFEHKVIDQPVSEAWYNLLIRKKEECQLWRRNGDYFVEKIQYAANKRINGVLAMQT